MDTIHDEPAGATPENPYLLLTPGPLTTSASVKRAMLRDWCTWDRDYNEIVQEIRHRLVRLACPGNPDRYTCTLMQGSGTFCVESAITTALPRSGKLLVLANGAYGLRMAVIAKTASIDHELLDFGETSPPDAAELRRKLRADPAITHVAVVHCETTTGMLNPVQAIGDVAREYGKVFLVDAMSSFGGIPMDMDDIRADYLVSSANKCIQGVPGFGFVIAATAEMQTLGGRARSHSLDLFDQWQTMENKSGKWRFTSPTHVVRAFARALEELAEEGGVEARHRRYAENHAILVDGMERLGFACLLEPNHRSPCITAFRDPDDPGYAFDTFYGQLKARGFVIYPGKVTALDTFRIGTIGHVFPEDMHRLLEAVEASMYWHRGTNARSRKGGPAEEQGPAPLPGPVLSDGRGDAMTYRSTRTCRGQVRLVVFDWAGTVVDHGCQAPIAAFVEGFRRKGVAITMEQARGPMGMEKRDHIREVAGIAEVARAWEAVHGRPVTDDDIDALYADFVPLLMEILPRHSALIPGVLEAVQALRNAGIRIGASTGYFSEAAKVVARCAAEAGHVPDALTDAGEVPAGRPAPWMIYRIMEQLNVHPAEAVVNVGDTTVDIETGLNAGVWSIGVAATGNETGLTLEELTALPPMDREERIAAARRSLARAGAHWVIDTMAELPRVVARINALLARGARP